MAHDIPGPGKLITAKWGRGLDSLEQYQPILTTDTTAPVLGDDGIITAFWAANGHRISVFVTVVYGGAGVNLGGASIRISLPLLADLGIHTPGALANAGTKIGDWKVYSSAGASDVPASGQIFLYQLNDGSLSGQAMIFYRNGTANTSLSGASGVFGTAGAFMAEAQYTADGAELT